MNIEKGLFYTKEHEWVKIEANQATIGISDYAQHSLGDITFVELPKIGDELKQFKIFSTVESVKAASDVYAPLSGKIVKVNEEIVSNPQAINQSPYKEGWFIVIEIENEDEKKNLLNDSDYKEYTEALDK